MKQRQLKTKVGRDGSDRISKWSRQAVVIVLALLMSASPLFAMPIVEPEEESSPSVCVLTAHDWWVYRVSERMRLLAQAMGASRVSVGGTLMAMRAAFIFGQLKNGRYECTG